MTTAENHVVDPEKYGPRTWKHDLKLFHFKAEWKPLAEFYTQTAQGLILPNMMWLLLLNGAFLGVYVYQVSTFAQILQAPPYSFKSGYVGYVQMAQIIDCLLMLPILGYGSDFVVRVMSKLHKGVFEVCDFDKST